ncbi:MAG TPA: hypothetical protein VH595_05970 [Verrucomicrobiae bacterium]|jgi:hypothetical protein|nr:hypothetical protein [Verrucomicrobiae bacterium]
MMTPEGMERGAVILMARGMDEEKAYLYMQLLGDIREEDDSGKWIIRDETGAIIDRIEPID